MEKHVEKAMKLRNEVSCPNCAETILQTYSEKLGLSEGLAMALGTNFGGGMKTGGVCGAVSASLMVLGALGITDPAIVGGFQSRIKEKHGGNINCSDLLKANSEAGGKKKPHCDGMIKESIELIEEYRKGIE
jgi:C_GCAxxG_C_C family probable redox protein